MELGQEVGRLLQLARENAKLSQDRAAELLGFKRRETVAEHEGGRIPKLEILQKYADVYGVDVHALLPANPDALAIYQPRGSSPPAESDFPSRWLVAEPTIPSWPQAARLLVKEFELEVMKQGATDEEVAAIQRALIAPESYVLYKDGRAHDMTEAELLTEMRGLMEGLRVWLRNRIARRNGRR